MAKSPAPRSGYSPRPIPQQKVPQQPALPKQPSMAQPAMAQPAPVVKPFGGAAADPKASAMQRVASAFQQMGCMLVTKELRREAWSRKMIIPESIGGEIMLLHFRSQRVISIGMYQVYSWNIKTQTRNRGSSSVSTGTLVKALDDSLIGNTSGPFSSIAARLSLS